MWGIICGVSSESGRKGDSYANNEIDPGLRAHRGGHGQGGHGIGVNCKKGESESCGVSSESGRKGDSNANNEIGPGHRAHRGSHGEVGHGGELQKGKK